MRSDWCRRDVRHAECCSADNEAEGFDVFLSLLHDEYKVALIYLIHPIHPNIRTSS